ncbi:hypothetical protein [Paracraurococcus ruber]|uniref:Uncharacterized protein n=1 Tax=Paracraurococcus ruber TaxID=77675 RepID=A0ABS1CVS1_9PROT|nr:hypothetical protein [Paracraurococcus ruber]MBK1658620.1 hypothetical protein [Paracraurococcus ruber]TDG30808.1 hypothetical protein E2C05_13020 [Paracraurococcus ruber]
MSTRLLAAGRTEAAPALPALGAAILLLAVLAALPGPALFVLLLAGLTFLAMTVAGLRRRGGSGVPPLPYAQEA